MLYLVGKREIKFCIRITRLENTEDLQEVEYGLDSIA